MFGLTSAGLSQVSLVRGSGSSCSQPSLAKRPSCSEGEGRKTTSRPPRDPLPPMERAQLGQGLGGERGNDLGKLAAGKQAIMQDAVPLRVEVSRAEDRCPGLPHDVVAGTILVSRHQPEHFDRRPATEQGQDQRLDDAERAADRTRVSPRFEVMRAGKVPGRLDRCFVDRVPERDRLWDLGQGRGEVEIGGRIEYRIAAQDDERLDRAACMAATSAVSELRLGSTASLVS